jgi:exosortase
MSVLTTEISVKLHRADAASARQRLVSAAIRAALLFAAYTRTIVFTAHIVASSDDMAQGLFAPFVAAYIAWTVRDKLRRGSRRGASWGLTLLITGALFGIWAILADSMTLSRAAFLISLSGAITVVWGLSGLRTLLFPLTLLLFTFPLSPVLYGELTAPLQDLATRLSEGMFDLIGITALREGNILHLPSQTLSIVEACSGLRSLLTILFFTLAYVYLFEQRAPLRIITTVLCIPAAIAMNVLRITVTGYLAERVNRQLITGLPHEILGWVCFFIAVILIVAVHQSLVRRLVPGKEVTV